MCDMFRMPNYPLSSGLSLRCIDECLPGPHEVCLTTHIIEHPIKEIEMPMTSWRSLFGSVRVVKKDGKLDMVARAGERKLRPNGSSSSRTKSSGSRKHGSFAIDSRGNASVVTSNRSTDEGTASERDSLELVTSRC